jgi:hypothetical protein
MSSFNLATGDGQVYHGGYGSMFYQTMGRLTFLSILASYSSSLEEWSEMLRRCDLGFCCCNAPLSFARCLGPGIRHGATIQKLHIIMGVVSFVGVHRMSMPSACTNVCREHIVCMETPGQPYS